MNNLEQITFQAGLVANFIMKCILENPGQARAPYPTDDFGYAKALLDWEANDKSPLAFYGTEDELLLVFREEVKAEFGLEVLTMVEAEARERDLEERVARVSKFQILHTHLPGETV